MGEEPKCCICGCSEVLIVWEANLPPDISAQQYGYSGDKRYHGRIVQCGDCRHRYVYPLPTNGSGPYADVQDDYYMETFDERARTIREFLDFKESICPERGTLLDIGCNTGILLEIAQDRGYSVEGIEPSRWATGIARQQGFTVHEGTIEELPATDTRYDAITALDVIEHLSDPLTALRIAKNLLKPGGCFVGVVPDMGTWHAKLLGRHHWQVITMHYHYFTRRTLAHILHEAGFAKIRITAAPPYRIRFKDALKIARQNPFLRLPFTVASKIPGIDNFEIRLNCGLFCLAWK